ncbi:MAG: TonB family protein [Alphaproteobacteria bacterium]|nr:TonB family protein [Alphaproteobacteria bacterium]
MASIAVQGRKKERITWEVPASVALHVLLALLIFLAQCGSCAGEPPLVNPDNVMRVSAVALPKQTGRLPDKPSRTPDNPVAAKEAPPEPVAEAPKGQADAAKPVPNASDMSLQKDEPRKGTTKDRTDAREALLNSARREALVKDPNAPLGDTDRPRTSPDGVSIDEAIFGPGGDGINDPELARWKVQAEEALRANWTPLPATVAGHPDYVVYLVVPVGPDGKLGKPQVYKGTGDSGFDRSAIMAVMKTGRVPPPPEKWRGSTTKGVVMEFPAGAKR